MVTRIFKINENITAYEKSKARIEEIKDELECRELCLANYGKNIDDFKGMTDEEFNKRWK